MRVKKSILNFVSAYVFYFIIGILGFVKIRLFVNYLGEDILALNQLYLNIFSYLSIIEAGLGAGLTYRLYKLLINKDHNKINELISGTQYLFRRIALIMLGIGAILSFLVPVFIKDNQFDSIYLNITFMLFVVKNVIDYYLFTPRFVVQADQRMYKINILIYTARLVEICVEIFIIISGLDYIFVLMPSLIIRIIQNLIINKRVRKLYKWFKFIKNKDISAKGDIKSLFVHRVSGLVFNNIDIVLLSTFVGSAGVTIYAAYYYVVKYAQDTVAHLFNAIKDGLGNVINSENAIKIRGTINEINTIFSFLAVLLVIIFYFVLSPFVSIWIGSEYIVDAFTLILFLVVIYNKLTIRSSTMVRTTMGLFKETQAMAITEAAINLILSLILVHFLQIKGVLIATVTARLLTNFWYLPYVTSKKLFDVFNWKDMEYHFKNIIIIILLIFSLAPLNNVVLSSFYLVNLWSWMLYSIALGILVLCIVSIIFYFAFKPFRLIIKKVLRSIKNFKIDKNI